MKSSTNLNLYGYAVWVHHDMKGPVTMAWVLPTVDRLGRLGAVHESVEDLLSYSILLEPAPVYDNPGLRYQGEQSIIVLGDRFR